MLRRGRVEGKESHWELKWTDTIQVNALSDPSKVGGPKKGRHVDSEYTLEERGRAQPIFILNYNGWMYTFYHHMYMYM